MTPSVYAIIPAAGRSRRMGTAKQLLDVGGRAMLAAVVEPLAAANTVGVAVVTHSTIAKAVADRLPSNAFIALNDDETTEMIDSVRIGLHAWQDRATVADHDGFLICPGDHPGITTADFNACIAAFRARPDRIIIAAHHGKRGHPLIFPSSYVTYVLSPACDQGLNALPRQHASAVLTVNGASCGISEDIDTPADLQRRRDEQAT